MAQGKKLSQKKVDRIYELLDQGLSQKDIAKKVKVGRKTVSDYKIIREKDLDSTGDLSTLRARNLGFADTTDYQNYCARQRIDPRTGEKFDSLYDRRNFWAEENDFESFYEQNKDWMERNGFKRPIDYANHLAREQEYDSYNDLINKRARGRGYRNAMHEKRERREQRELSDRLRQPSPTA